MIARLTARLKGRGPGEVLALAGKNVAHALRHLSPGAAAAQRRSLAFDLRWGTDTTTLANLSELSVDRGRARHGVRYQPSSGEALEWAVAAAGVEPSDYSFVDYGCGKGRIVMLASAMGFARTVGVEFAPELCSTARENVRRFVDRGGSPRAAEIVESDAGAYAPPPGPVFAYLYNPFGPAVLAEVVAKLEAHAASGAPVWVSYVDPRHPELFGAERWDVAARQDGATLLRAR